MLTLLWALPFLAGVAVLLSPRAGLSPRRVALSVAAVSLVLVGALPLLMGAENLPFAVEATAPWGFGIRYSLGIDGLSWCLCLLTALLTVVSLLSSWREERPAAYWACFLFLEASCLGVFLARDLFFFYIFWEGVLIPMFFIIGLWGSDNRRHAAVKFFLFTFFGSVLLLLGILVLVTYRHGLTGAWSWSWSLSDMPAGPPGRLGLAVFLALVVGFGVKIPLVPFHTWLPDAHTEAPAAGSIMLAGVLLKLGVYGMLRVAIPAFRDLSWSLLPWLGLAAAVNILYGAIAAMAQSDFKRLIAYSSVAHLGFCVLGILSRTQEGLSGGTLQLLNHGLSTGALFLLVGALYERTHKRGIRDFGGLAARAPWMTFFFGFSVFASIGLPGLNGFVGEFMALSGMTHVLPVLAILGVLGVTLAAGYLLPAFQSVFWGEAGPESASSRVTDLDAREMTLLGALSLLMLWIGIHPAPLLALLSNATRGLIV